MASRPLCAPMNTPTGLDGFACPVCGGRLAGRVVQTRRGRQALALHCASDPRHLRAFVHHAEFVVRAAGDAHPTRVRAPPQVGEPQHRVRLQNETRLAPGAS